MRSLIFSVILAIMAVLGLSVDLPGQLLVIYHAVTLALAMVLIVDAIIGLRRLSDLKVEAERRTQEAQAELAKARSALARSESMLGTRDGELSRVQATLQTLRADSSRAQETASAAAAAEGRKSAKLADAHVVAFLGLLQQKGRFLDFLMDDVSKYPDTQIGAAARIVHQGCAAVVRDYFQVQPVHSGAEGEAFTVEKNFDPHCYRLLGRVAGEPPFRGRVLHRGWLTTAVKLPTVAVAGAEIEDDAGRQPGQIIMPAEVEVNGG